MRILREKNFFKQFSLSQLLGASALFVLVLGTGLTFWQLKKQQDLRQSAQGAIEFGFNTHLSVTGATSSLNFEKFKKNVDEIALNGKKWLRFDLPPAEIATIENPANPTPTSELTPAFTPIPPTPTPTTPPPTPTNTPVAGTAAAVPQTVAPMLIWNEGNLAIYDQAIDYAKSRELKIFLVTTVPIGAKDLSIAEYKTLAAQFYQFLALRYKGKVNVWQIFNEPNIHNFRDYSILPGLSDFYLGEYNSVLNQAKTVIKSVDEGAFVTANAGGWPINDSLRGNWSDFFAATKDNIDFATIDLYPDNNLEVVNQLGSIIDGVRTASGKEVYVGEIGMCTRGGRFTESDQAIWSSKSLLALSVSNAKAVIYYEIQDSDLNTCEGSFGIKRQDDTQKVGYPAIMSYLKMPPTPTPTPTASPTPTPTPTPLPEATATLTPTPTLTPTSNPTPTLTSQRQEGSAANPTPTLTPTPASLNAQIQNSGGLTTSPNTSTSTFLTCSQCISQGKGFLCISDNQSAFCSDVKSSSADCFSCSSSSNAFAPQINTPTNTPCNADVVCSGSCNAKANTCHENNGLQRSCVYTTHLELGNNCKPATAPDQKCTINSCGSKYKCLDGNCIKVFETVTNNTPLTYKKEEIKLPASSSGPILYTKTKIKPPFFLFWLEPVFDFLYKILKFY